MSGAERQDPPGRRSPGSRRCCSRSGSRPAAATRRGRARDRSGDDDHDDDGRRLRRRQAGGVGSGSDFDPQAIYADAAPSVVTILSLVGDPPDPTSAGQGSGFVISDDGEIVTNAHVVTDATEAGGSTPINEADEVYVEFGDRNQVPAEIVGTDLNADVALIKVDPDGLDLDPIELGDSDSVQVGAPVAAIGSPFGQEQSMSVGIVSATDRSIDSLTQFKIDGAIQTDTSINPGNSGGPLIGADGRVVGIDQQINTTSGGNEGVGFAVPINLVKRSVDQLRENGKVEYAYIGVSSQPLYPQLAEKLGIDAPTGSLISSVVSGGPADEAGLQGSGRRLDDRVPGPQGRGRRRHDRRRRRREARRPRTTSRG